MIKFENKIFSDISQSLYLKILHLLFIFVGINTFIDFLHFFGYDLKLIVMPRRDLLCSLVNIAMVATKDCLPLTEFVYDLLFITICAVVFAEHHRFSRVEHLVSRQIASAPSTDKLANLKLENFRLRIIIELFEGTWMRNSILYEDFHPAFVAVEVEVLTFLRDQMFFERILFKILLLRSLRPPHILGNCSILIQDTTFERAAKLDFAAVPCDMIQISIVIHVPVRKLTTAMLTFSEHK